MSELIAVSKIFKELVGLSIVNVRRYIYKDDKFLADYEQLADGPIELTFSNGFCCSFYPCTEKCSIEVSLDKLKQYGPSYELINPSSNNFWKNFIGQEIDGIRFIVLKSKKLLLTDFIGVSFSFKNEKKFTVEYVDYGEFSDSLRVVTKVKMENIDFVDL